MEKIGWTERELKDRYFDWLYELVCNDSCHSNRSYRSLFEQLMDIEFTYTIPLDGNRAEDGIDLRYRFGDDVNCDERVIASILDVRPCSVLEMMVALAIRCEEHIMVDPDIGDRTAKWFWIMIDNLGLGTMHDRRYDADLVEESIDIFLNREYGRDGKGGLFTVDNPRRDMREVEIWYQMNWYLSEHM